MHLSALFLSLFVARNEHSIAVPLVALHTEPLDRVVRPRNPEMDDGSVVDLERSLHDLQRYECRWFDDLEELLDG